MPKSIDLIHRILIVEDGHLPEHIPDRLAQNMSSAARVYPHAEQRLWSGRDLREFIDREFGSYVLDAYDQIRPFAFKCDLARYCLLCSLGGLYVDLGVECVASIEVPDDKGIMAFRDWNCLSSPSWTTLSQGVLWSEPRRSELRLAIDMIVENCSNRFYGANPLYPTGPVLLGRTFVAHMARQGQTASADDQWVGTRPNDAEFITPDGRLVASRNDRQGGGFPGHGVRGTNDYNHYWYERAMYGEPCGPTRGRLEMCVARREGGVRIAGWAQDAERPDTPVSLAVTVNGGVVATVRADVFSEGLAAMGIGAGSHGFELDCDAAHLPGGALDVEVYRAINGATVGKARLEASESQFRQDREATRGDAEPQLVAMTEEGLIALADKLLPYIASRSLHIPRFWGDKDRLTVGRRVSLCNTFFNLGSGNVYIGDYAFFGQNASVLTGTHDMRSLDIRRQRAIPRQGRDVHIQRGVWICSNATIVGPCTIGEHAVIGAGSVVTGDVRPGWFYAGVPARPIRPVRGGWTRPKTWTGWRDCP